PLLEPRSPPRNPRPAAAAATDITRDAPTTSARILIVPLHKEEPTCKHENVTGIEDEFGDDREATNEATRRDKTAERAEIAERFSLRAQRARRLLYTARN